MTGLELSAKAYYADEHVELYVGDAFDLLEGASGSVDAVVMDPPYVLPTQAANNGRLGAASSTVGDLSMVERILRGLFDLTSRLTGSSGRHFVFCDGTSYPVVFRAMYGKASTALLVWDKGRIGMGREFRKAHELVMHAWGVETELFSDGVGRADVLRCSPVPSKDRIHPAEKPVALVAELLRVCGPLILDPFAGSCSTLLAARATGRRAVGFEIDERHAEAAARRLEALR